MIVVDAQLIKDMNKLELDFNAEHILPISIYPVISKYVS